MSCRSSYTDCIRRLRPSSVRAELLAQEVVTAGERRLPSGLGGRGQSAFTGLYRLSNYCYAR